MDTAKSENPANKERKAKQSEITVKSEINEIISDGSASAFEGTEAIDSAELSATAQDKNKEEKKPGNVSGQSNY